MNYTGTDKQTKINKKLALVKKKTHKNLKLNQQALFFCKNCSHGASVLMSECVGFNVPFDTL